MKLPWKRDKPQDLVGEAVSAYPPPDVDPADVTRWAEWMTPEQHAQALGAGLLMLPQEISFPGDAALSASGGWCAPTEALYDAMTAAAGRPEGHPASLVPLILEVPQVQMTRGGIRHQPSVRRPAAPRPEPVYPNPAFLAASVANPGLLPLAFMKDPTAP